jgi:two-component system NtrC family sensor kinase
MAEIGEPETRVDYIRQAQEELGRVSHIVTQSLRFHRQADRPATTRLGEIVESVLMLFRTRLGHAATKVEVADSQTAELICYGSDLRQVVANLIRDAVDAATGLPGVRLTVADSGVGMSVATRARLFEPFFSTKGARGTGLGLWVSHGILEKHGAKLRVKSRQGIDLHKADPHGTIFSIFFPLGVDLESGSSSDSPSQADN